MTLSRSRIPWLVNADGTPGYTWSPTSGCSPVSAGCDNCWARAYHVRYRGGDFSVKLHPDQLDAPLRLRKPSTIGVCLLGDLFHPDVPLSFLTQVATTMDRAASKGHTLIVLTKRIDRACDWLQAVGEQPPNGIWWGVSVEDQATADARIPILLDTPAAHRFVSLEPQIGAVEFKSWWLRGQTCDVNEHGEATHGPALDLVIQGCESGAKRRPFDVQWARDVRDQCKAAGVAYAYKQGPFGHSPVAEKPPLDGRVEWSLPWAQGEGRGDDAV